MMETARDQAGLNRRWRPALMAFFLRRIHDHAEAEDLTQEVFARVLGQADGGAAHEGYVFQIAHNLLSDRARRSKVRREYRESVGQIDGLGVELLDPHRIAQGRAALATFAQNLDELPELTRDIFTLYRIEEISMLAIAETFDISLTTVKKHVRKAMAFMIRRMKGVQ